MLSGRQYSTGNKLERHDVRLRKCDIMILTFSTRCNTHRDLALGVEDIEEVVEAVKWDCLPPLWALLSPSILQPVSASAPGRSMQEFPHCLKVATVMDPVIF